MTTVLIRQLAAALAAYRTKQGHFPCCGHGNWLRDFDNQRLHACHRPDCNGQGIPCSERCRAANAALAAAEAWLAQQVVEQQFGMEGVG